MNDVLWLHWDRWERLTTEAHLMSFYSKCFGTNVTVLPAGWLSWGSSSRICGGEGPLHLHRGSVCPSGHTVPQTEGTNCTETGPSSIPAAPQVNTCNPPLPPSAPALFHWTDLHLKLCDRSGGVRPDREAAAPHLHKKKSIYLHLMSYTLTFLNCL